MAEVVPHISRQRRFVLGLFVTAAILVAASLLAVLGFVLGRH
jgi:hypothetical protein